jgi:hypothetical protein
LDSRNAIASAPNRCVEGREIDAVDQALLFGPHAFDLSSDAAKLELHRQDIRQFAGALPKKIRQALFGVARVREPPFSSMRARNGRVRTVFTGSLNNAAISP